MLLPKLLFKFQLLTLPEHLTSHKFLQTIVGLSTLLLSVIRFTISDLNICDVIWVCVPVDLSILVIWKIVLPAVAGEARPCENFEIRALPFHIAFCCCL
jgi:hypothetical protein